MQATPLRSLASTLVRCSASTSNAGSSAGASSAAAILAGVARRSRPGKGKARQQMDGISTEAGDGNNGSTPDRSASHSGHLRQVENHAKYLTALPHPPNEPFDLGAFHHVYDINPALVSYPAPNIKFVHIADPAMFPRPDPQTTAWLKSRAIQMNSDPLIDLSADASTRFGARDLRDLHKYPLIIKRVVNMTSKGKQPSMYVLTVVGDGNGLVGYGEGKDESVPAASDKAFVQAVKNLDYVQRKDGRTTWADEMKGKWGATTVELRSRPPGFGLRTSPVIHQIAKAAGISDLSAKIRGSRNDMNTVKAVINLLHGGAAPVGLGDLSGKGKLARRFKGSGMRTAQEVGLNLGRRAIEVR